MADLSEKLLLCMWMWALTASAAENNTADCLQRRSDTLRLSITHLALRLCNSFVSTFHSARLQDIRRFWRNAYPRDMLEYLWVELGQRWKCERKVTGIPVCAERMHAETSNTDYLSLFINFTILILVWTERIRFTPGFKMHFQSSDCKGSIEIHYRFHPVLVSKFHMCLLRPLMFESRYRARHGE